ncbi:MAG: SET domain-containing protein [Pirellulales bacterium]|nr:SET domain-containing protein [Pirellulales bacterium]
MTRKVEKRVEIRQTIVGRGVFARRDFKKGDVIGEITGGIMDFDYESDYCMDLDGSAVLEPAPPFRFLNHSCAPNCELLLWKYRKIKGPKLHRLWVEATTRIREGDELTIDYAWPLEAAIPCACRADNCRGWIVEEGSLPQLQKLRPTG